MNTMKMRNPLTGEEREFTEEEFFRMLSQADEISVQQVRTDAYGVEHVTDLFGGGDDDDIPFWQGGTAPSEEAAQRRREEKARQAQDAALYGSWEIERLRQEAAELRAERERKEAAKRAERERKEAAKRAEREREEAPKRIAHARKQRIAGLSSERESLQNELSKLTGFFNGSRRREIQSRLDDLDVELKKAVQKEKSEIIVHCSSNHRFASAEKGKTITFGDYHGPIEWIVLEQKDNWIFVISKYGLDAIPFNWTYTALATWETCSLRSWLNKKFLYKAFSPEERAMIRTVPVKARANPQYPSSAGNDTWDKVFLLNIQEANRYLSKSERMCVPTDYAKLSRRSCLIGDNGCCWWWLRSPGFLESIPARIVDDGSVYDIGGVDSEKIGVVRPALWIDLDS